MIVHLRKDLERASDDTHSPSTTSADSVRARIGRTRNRRRNVVLAALVALAVIAGLVAWFRPVVRFGPAPTPTPSASPTSDWWQENYRAGDDPSVLEMPEEEIRRRCEMTAAEALGPVEFESRAPGTPLHIFQTAADVPDRTDVSDQDGNTWPEWNFDEDKARTCYLGYATTGDGKMISQHTFSDEATNWKGLCADSSGFPFDGTWHVAAAPLDEAANSRMVGLYSEEGELVMCEFSPGSEWVNINFVSQPEPGGTCVDVGANGGVVQSDEKGSTIRDVNFHSLTFVRDKYGKTTRATRLRVQVVGQARTVEFPVNDGILVANATLRLEKPLPLKTDQDWWGVQVRVTGLDDAGQKVFTCTTP